MGSDTTQRQPQVNASERGQAADNGASAQDKSATSAEDRLRELKLELPPVTTDEAAMRLFAEPLIRGALEHREETDAVIKKHAINWELHRIAAVDRNILRLAIYEMLHRDDIPPIVSINEAVDIAKKFSTQDSGKFVNGILDKVKSELMRPARGIK